MIYDGHAMHEYAMRRHEHTCHEHGGSALLVSFVLFCLSDFNLIWEGVCYKLWNLQIAFHLRSRCLRVKFILGSSEQIKNFLKLISADTCNVIPVLAIIYIAV